MFITITEKKKIEKVVEINFPFYSKIGDYYYYAILSENDTIRLSISSDNTSVWYCRVNIFSLMQEAAEGEPISEEVFNSKKNKVLQILNK